MDEYSTKFSRVQTKVPPRTQHIYEISKNKGLPPAVESVTDTPPPSKANDPYDLQHASLVLTSFPLCTKLCTLAEYSPKNSYEITCSHCGPLSANSTATVRQRQIDIIQTAFTPHTATVTEKEVEEMAPNPHPATTTNTDAVMTEDVADNRDLENQ